jgi:hypothetical protein
MGFQASEVRKLRGFLDVLDRLDGVDVATVLPRIGTSLGLLSRAGRELGGVPRRSCQRPIR